MFSFTTKNWAAVPLVSHQVIIDLISATTTKTGLAVHAELDDGDYPLGAKATDQQMAALPISKPRFHPEWVYTLHPAPEAARTGQAVQDALDDADRLALEAAEATGQAGHAQGAPQTHPAEPANAAQPPKPRTPIPTRHAEPGKSYLHTIP
jgi:hypothetical protein